MISVDSLSKSFGDVHAVRDLTFTVRPGAVTGFLGPNGAGKTTTLRMILGLVTPTSGSATIDGSTYADLQSPLTKVGAVLETSAFYPGHTAQNHLRALCIAGGIPATRVAEVLKEVDLEHAARRRIGGFSLGMRQRLAMACVLVGDPEVLILDEPANGLDPEGIHWLRGFLRALAIDGRTVLLSSHGLTEMDKIADRILIINHGSLIADKAIGEFEAGLEDAYLRLIRAAS